MKPSKEKLKSLPAVDAIMRHPSVANLKEQLAPHVLAKLAREVVNALREEVSANAEEATAARLLDIAVERLHRQAQGLLADGLKRVINGTGIVLHTGLGRAVLASEAQKHLMEIAAGYCSLEIDLQSGRRGGRQTYATRLLQLLTGAESACVVNNNAAATMLVLNTLADRKEVIVSRGELVEIGGSFRLPEIIKKSGARLVEVGTTNKTRLRDYARAIGPKTAVLLKVHPSNFRIKGFTEEARLEEIVDIGKQHGVPVVHDLGGGILVDLRKFGLPEEPVVEDSIKSGAQVVTFSGDKILGGPQAGIIVGEKKYIEEIYRNPLLRVVRCDKLTLALLESSLKIFLKPQAAIAQQHAVMRMLSEPLQAVKARATHIAEKVRDISELQIIVEETAAEAGSGALPVEPLPSYGIGLKAAQYSDASLAARLRQSEPPVIAYTHDGWVWLDARTIRDGEIDELVHLLRALCKRV
jgi:L-seryl-tRNA(Ser) seleniumtransferase